MKIYVAGKWQDRVLCKSLMLRLERAGHTITRDWTNRKPEDVLSDIAVMDGDGVATANMIVIIALEDHKFRGAYVELGMAIAYGKGIVIIGDGMRECIFSHHPQVTKVADIQEFFDQIVNPQEGEICPT